MSKTLPMMVIAIIIAGCGGTQKTYDAAHQCSPTVAGLCDKIGARPVTADRCLRIEKHESDAGKIEDYCVLRRTR